MHQKELEGREIEPSDASLTTKSSKIRRFKKAPNFTPNFGQILTSTRPKWWTKTMAGKLSATLSYFCMARVLQCAIWTSCLPTWRQKFHSINFFCRDVNPQDADQERRLRREIANSNERRRMQSINAGFQSLRTLLPHHEGEKLSKVGPHFFDFGGSKLDFSVN